MNAVIVSTSEGEHVEPMLKAIELGKQVLVEKPIALTLADADRVISAVEKAGADVRVGYSRRYKERYLIAKEQIVQGRVGTIVGGAARVFNSRSQAHGDAGAQPARDAGGGCAHLLRGPHELAARRHAAAGGLRARPEGRAEATRASTSNDVSYAILTYADGTVVNLGISYALPDKYPARGHAARVEVLGTEGVMILDDDHTDQLMYSEKGMPHVYLPDQEREHGVPAERHAGRLGARRVLGPDRQRDARVARSSGDGQAVRARDGARGARDARRHARDRAFAGERQAGAAAAGGCPKSLTGEGRGKRRGKAEASAAHASHENALAAKREQARSRADSGGSAVGTPLKIP